MEDSEYPELDWTQKREGHAFLTDTISRVGAYMAAAIQYANHQAGLPDEEFWQTLFRSTGGGPGDAILTAGRGSSPDRCPAYPYEKLDFQACNKYLRFGGQRWLPEKKSFASDSLNFCRTFHVAVCTDKKGRRFPKEYGRVLDRARKLRNQQAHDRSEVVGQVTRESIEADLGTLKELTAPIQRKANWKPEWREPLVPLAEFWAEIDAKCRERFGCVPIPMEELGRELFLSAEDNLTPEQKRALEEAADFLKLKYQNGKVYEEERQALKQRLIRCPSVTVLLGGKAAATPEEAAEQVRRPQAPPRRIQAQPPRFLQVSVSNASEILRRASTMLQPRPVVLTALLDCFTLLVDESFFLSEGGQSLLNRYLLPLLAGRKETLLVDESVVISLFRAFRGSAPYTELELAQLEPDTAEELREERRKIHRDSKNAIKLLRRLRQYRCLEVVYSPTGSGQSYVNLRQVAAEHPESRFLALTMDQQLAEELSALPNAAAAKPNLVDCQLKVYRASKANYLAMLSEPKAGGPPAAPASQETVLQPLPTDSKTLLSISELPKTGSRVTAQSPDGSRWELMLGQQVGPAGGEGTVYAGGQGGSTVAKIYHREQLTQERREKLDYMVRIAPGIPGLCWPQALLFNRQGEWAGYLMPQAKAKELCLTVYKPGRNNHNITALGWDRRSLALIAANVAGIFAQMHQRDILMGDVNPRNFMVAQDCSVYFVDCDSYQFGAFDCPVRSDRYTPPEVLKAVRRSGRDSYNYRRTLDHERYSMAVVLFEILMLGKSPYESRDTDNGDVLDAIMAGNFPYPFRTGGEDDHAKPDQTPVGRWREIWSHMTYQIKTGFYNTFTGKGRLSAEEWEKLLREYVRQIELGHSSSDLAPEGFKDLDGTMLNKVCSQCGKNYNIDEDTYRRRSRWEPDLCPTHRIMYRNFQKREYEVTCDVCGTPFQSLVAVWEDRTQKGLPMLCPNCKDAQVKCAQCGRLYSVSRDRLSQLQGKDAPLLCPECLELERPQVVCERCRKTFRKSVTTLERIRRDGQAVLCGKCLRELQEQG